MEVMPTAMKIAAVTAKRTTATAIVIATWRWNLATTTRQQKGDRAPDWHDYGSGAARGGGQGFVRYVKYMYVHHILY